MLAGLCGGRLLGNVMLQQLVLQQSSLSIFIVRPVAEYRYVMNLLSSENELDRLAGYYSLSTYGMVDNRFLEERFKREGSEYIKRTIIWLISNKMEKRNIHFFSEIFKTTSRTVKEQILESIYRYDKNEFNRFIDENNVSTDLIKDIVGQESL
ncbi:MAG: hypothetical protein ACOCX9_04915 [Spirochaetota bacterium]